MGADFKISSTIVSILAWAVQIWLFVYLMVLGPLPHFLGIMPGPNNIFNFKGFPKKMTNMFGIGYGILGTAAYFTASSAILHFLVFVRKMLQGGFKSQVQKVQHDAA